MAQYLVIYCFDGQRGASDNCREFLAMAHHLIIAFVLCNCSHASEANATEGGPITQFKMNPRPSAQDRKHALSSDFRM